MWNPIEEFASTPEEWHRLVYGFLKGFFIVWSPYKLREELEVDEMSFSAWENGEGQYQDPALVLGYALGWAAVAWFGLDKLLLGGVL